MRTRTDYEISIYEGTDFTEEMVQDIHEMCEEGGNEFNFAKSRILIQQTHWDPYVDLPEWSKKHPDTVFEIQVDYEDEDEVDILFIKNGKYRYLGDEARYREELLTIPGTSIKSRDCLSWSPSLFFNSKDVNPKPLYKEERYIVIGEDDKIGVGAFINGNWDTPFKVIYWKYI